MDAISLNPLKDGRYMASATTMVSMSGAQGRNRTTDTAIFSRMLYQLSYLGIEG